MAGRYCLNVGVNFDAYAAAVTVDFSTDIKYDCMKWDKIAMYASVCSLCILVQSQDVIKWKQTCDKGIQQNHTVV